MNNPAVAMDNTHGLKNIQKITKEPFNETWNDLHSDIELECLVNHTGVQRTYVNKESQHVRFEIMNYKVGDVLPRNRIRLYPNFWKLVNNMTK